MADTDTSPDDETPADDEAGTPDAATVDQPTRYGALLDDSRGQTVLHVERDRWLDVAGAARADGFAQLSDLTAVDYSAHAGTRHLPPDVTPERFEVVACLLDPRRPERIRLRVQVPDGEPRVPSLFDLWPGSEALEREAYDMFGIEFTDHPDLTRILMPEEWVGHPLRKDFATGEIPVQFKAASNVR